MDCVLKDDLELQGLKLEHSAHPTTQHTSLSPAQVHFRQTCISFPGQVRWCRWIFLWVDKRQKMIQRVIINYERLAYSFGLFLISSYNLN